MGLGAWVFSVAAKFLFMCFFFASFGPRTFGGQELLPKGGGWVIFL